MQKRTIILITAILILSLTIGTVGYALLSFYSNTVIVNVRPGYTIDLQATTDIVQGDTANFTATITSGSGLINNITVNLYAYSAGQWQLILTSHTDSNGVATFHYQLNEAGSYAFRAAIE